MISAKIDGFQALQRQVKRLQELEDVARVEPFVDIPAKKVLAEAQGKVPVATGTLREKIRIYTRRARQRLTKQIGVRDVKRARRAKSRDRAHVARFQEFGTVNHAAHPFLRPAFYDNRDYAYKTIRNGFKLLITGAVK